MSSIIALNNVENTNFINECKKAEQMKKVHPNVPKTVIDKLKEIWDEVFPHRSLNFDDSKVLTSFNILSENGQSIKIQYKGNEMSDGERVALYLISQCLCVPQNKTIIIDEPEIHLHRSIMNKLWSEIEKTRQDCLFVYITHDTQFAANHLCSEKIWVKEFDGNHWKIEKIIESSLPEQLLLDILGNRKNVLFVEGTPNSYDTKLYREIYNNYYVVPCGSCVSVINYTKAFKNTEQLHNLKCYGLIDRDYRSQYEIEKYKKDNIYCLKVAEVENIFLVPELLEYINRSLDNVDDSKVELVKKYVVEDRFLKEKNKQIYLAIISQTKYKLSSLELSDLSEDELDKMFQNVSSYIEYDKMKENIKTDYNVITTTQQYKECLKLFNRKDLIKSVGNYLGLRNEEYCEWILRKIHSQNKEEVIKNLIEYLPSEIER